MSTHQFPSNKQKKDRLELSHNQLIEITARDDGDYCSGLNWNFLLSHGDRTNFDFHGSPMKSLYLGQNKHQITKL